MVEPRPLDPHRPALLRQTAEGIARRAVEAGRPDHPVPWGATILRAADVVQAIDLPVDWPLTAPDGEPRDLRNVPGGF